MVLQERFVVSSSLVAAVRLVWLQLIESHPTNVFLRHASMSRYLDISILGCHSLPSDQAPGNAGKQSDA